MEEEDTYPGILYVQEAEEEKKEQVRDGVKEEKVERPYFKKIETKSKFK